MVDDFVTHLNLVKFKKQPKFTFLRNADYAMCSQAEPTQTLEMERKLPTLVESEVLLQTTPNYKACKNSYY